MINQAPQTSQASGEPLTVADLAQALPANLKSYASQGLADHINSIVADPIVAEQVREGFVSYASILKEGRYKLEDYLNAVVYVAYKMLGYNNQEAYARALPDRYKKLVARGATDKEISSYVSMYNSNKLVGLLLEQSQVPVWLLNMENHQKAINVAVSIMNDEDVSPKVRVEAANTVLTHTKKPETKNVNLNLGVAEESDGMKELKDMLADMAGLQRDLISKGVETRKIAHQKLGSEIELTAKDVTPKGDKA